MTLPEKPEQGQWLWIPQVLGAFASVAQPLLLFDYTLVCFPAGQVLMLFVRASSAHTIFSQGAKAPHHSQVSPAEGT